MPNANYLSPPLDTALYLSNAQTVTSDGYSTNAYDAKAANCFPKSHLVIQPFTLGTGESVTITLRQDDNSSMSSAADVMVIGTYTSSVTDPIIIPLDNNLITERYAKLHYNVSTSDSIDFTAFLSI